MGRPRKDEIREKILKLIRENDITSYKEMAKTIGVNEKVLRWYVHDISKSEGLEIIKVFKIKKLDFSNKR